MSKHNITFVIGGAASGKSAFAEQVIVETGRPKVYLATAQVYDTEMREKVAAHRDARGPDWETIEEPIAIADVIAARTSEQILLIDCLTLWLTNLILNEHDVDAAFSDFLVAIADAPCPVVIVSNEVGQGIVPDNALSRRFRAAQGQLNQRVAAQADRVVTVIAGLPMTLKGQHAR